MSILRAAVSFSILALAAASPMAVAAHQTAPSSAAQPLPATAPQITYIQIGRLLANPADGQVLKDKTLIVTDGKITEIRNGFHQGPGKTIDLRDSFVLPGMIDSHVHITFENGPTTEVDFLKKTPADLAFDGVVNGRKTLEAGFTTIVDPGATPEAILALRSAIATGKVLGPRIIASGSVGVHGGHTSLHGYKEEITTLLAHNGLCAGPDDCRRAVRQAVQRGVDVIKIAATGGVTTNTAAGLGQQIDDDELSAIVTTAHKLGRRVIAHAHGADGIKAAVRAGVDSIEHGSFLDPEAVELMKSHGTYLVPTLLAGETTRQQAESAAWLPPAVREKALLAGPKMIEATRLARKSGVKIAFGTDSAVSRHGENAREFSLMLKAGFSPLDAIRSATVWGAAHNRLSDQIGTLAGGKAADLIAVKGDPLQDITELERITFVMKGGQIAKQ